jgi:hypothetical protein
LVARAAETVDLEQRRQQAAERGERPERDCHCDSDAFQQALNRHKQSLTP